MDISGSLLDVAMDIDGVADTINDILLQIRIRESMKEWDKWKDEWGDISNLTPGAMPGGPYTPDRVVDDLINRNFKATYGGNVIARDTEGMASDGKFAMNVDFGDRSFSSAIEIQNTSRWGGVGMLTNGKFDSALGAPVGSNAFTGSHGTISKTDGSGNVQVMENFVKGKFYGPRAEGVGGIFSIQDSDGYRVDGSFAGKR